MELKVYIDRLKEGAIEKFSGDIPSSFLDLIDKDLVCDHPVHVKGDAYLANDHLIVNLELKATVKIPCSICNQMTEISLHVPDFTHAEPISLIKGSIFDLSELIREDILIQIPQFVECNQGNCPERETIKKFLKKKKEDGTSKEATQVYYPFSDL